MRYHLITLCIRWSIFLISSIANHYKIKNKNNNYTACLFVTTYIITLEMVSHKLRYDVALFEPNCGNTMDQSLMGGVSSVSCVPSETTNIALESRRLQRLQVSHTMATPAALATPLVTPENSCTRCSLNHPPHHAVCWLNSSYCLPT